MNGNSIKLKKEAIFDALQSIHLSSGTTINLTMREIECAAFWLRGYSANEIGENLGISHRTVQTYIQQLRNKFQCRKRTEVMRKIQALRLDKLLDDLFYLLQR